MDGPMAQQSVSRCMRQVTEALNQPNILKKYIRFPQSAQERQIIKEKFYAMYDLPGICGCIDCTHISIVKPMDHEERFFNRKHYHSINCQIICDPNCNILNVDASYGGATHDAFIWQNHSIREYFENLTNNTDETAMLLGDSGYPLRQYLMTPVVGALEGSPEYVYNLIQKRARSTIERTFGILKGRWRCLLAARTLQYKPEIAGKIIIACCVLHNMCLAAGLDELELAPDEVQVELNMQNRVQNVSGEALEEGHRARNALIQMLNRTNRQQE